jgi:inorganic pyrophosphatase
MTARKTITVMVESPKGFNQKFNYDPSERRFTLSKILPAGLVFPFDFGMIPGTKGEDGDPLDIIVISESATFPGCMVECRIIGALQADQTERDGRKMRNDRFLGVPVVSQLFPDTNELKECRKVSLTS